MKPFDTLNRLPAMPQETVWLQARMETLSVRESLILGAALMGNPAYDARDVINIFQSMSDYEVCYPAGSYEALGRYALRYDAQLPQELSEHIDLEQLGRNYEDEHPGLFFGNCYVEYPNQGPALRYNGENLACCVDDGWSVKVKLASPRCPDGVWLRLPDYEDANDGRPDEMRITLDELGVKIVDECTLLEARCILPGLGDLTEQYNTALEYYTALEEDREKRVRKSKELTAFTAVLKKQSLAVTEWDERLWITLLDTATVQRDGKIEFRFKSDDKLLK